LIGDHQQLRPSTAVYQLAREHHLDVSLFERLVRNDVEHCMLTVQHRMRPEIARLVNPLYTGLEDHDSVKIYPNIKGI
jgi:superfamily I DNA and/or RNA helicase